MLEPVCWSRGLALRFPTLPVITLNQRASHNRITRIFLFSFRAMSFSTFHPAVQQWFTSRIGQPTVAQLRGWESIARGQHTLIAAPTGSGKTLAAFLTAIDELIKEGCQHPLPDEVRVLYVSPLKALSTDIHK